MQFLRENGNIFAWQPQDMPGIPRELAEHSLKVKEVSVYYRSRLAVVCHGPTKSVGEERGGVSPEAGKAKLPRFRLAGTAPYFLLNPLYRRR